VHFTHKPYVLTPVFLSLEIDHDIYQTERLNVLSSNGDLIMTITTFHTANVDRLLLSFMTFSHILAVAGIKNIVSTLFAPFRELLRSKHIAQLSARNSFI